MKSVRLGDIAKIERNSVSPEAIVDGTTYVGLENIVSGGQFQGVGPVDNGDLASSKFSFSEDHILYGKLRPYLAKIAVPSFSGVCSTDILPIRVGASSDRMYVKHFLRQQSVVDQVNSLATGANLPRVNSKVLETIELPLPPLEEQRRIAAILDKADELREKRRRALAYLDSLSKSIFSALLSSGVHNMSPLSDLIRVASGKFLPAKDMAKDGGFLVYGGNGVNGRHDAYFVEERTIVIGRVGAYCGAVHLTLPKSWVTDNALMVKILRTDIETSYLLAALQSADLNQYANQSGQPSISGSKIYPVEIPLPPPDFQKTFGTRVAAVERLKESHRKHLAELDTLFASLQHRAFKGEL